MTMDPAVLMSWGLKDKGIVILVAGKATAQTGSVKSDSVILLTPIAPLLNLGILSVANVVPGVSFDIRSLNLLDGSAVMWAVV